MGLGPRAVPSSQEEPGRVLLPFCPVGHKSGFRVTWGSSVVDGCPDDPAKARPNRRKGWDVFGPLATSLALELGLHHSQPWAFGHLKTPTLLSLSLSVLAHKMGRW